MRDKELPKEGVRSQFNMFSVQLQANILMVSIQYGEAIFESMGALNLIDIIDMAL